MNIQSLREKQLRQNLRAIFGKSSYSDDVIEVIVNTQLGKWSDADIEAYLKLQKQEFEAMKREFGDPLPLEEQIIHNPAVYYHNEEPQKNDNIEYRIIDDIAGNTNAKNENA